MNAFEVVERLKRAGIPEDAVVIRMTEIEAKDLFDRLRMVECDDGQEPESQNWFMGYRCEVHR